jgi:hypothetical protein
MANFPSNLPKWKPSRAAITINLPDTGIRQIVDSMLQLNPEERYTASRLLQDPFFDQIRNSAIEKPVTDCFDSHGTRDKYSKPYMNKMTDINEAMRKILVDWLLAVSKLFKMHISSYILSCTYLDQVLPLINQPRDKLQLVGIACMSFAAQIAERYSPELDDYVYISGGAYSKKDVNDMRLQIFNLLNGDFLTTTPYVYFEEGNLYEISYSEWQLAKAVIITATISDIRFELLPHDLYHFCLAMALNYLREEEKLSKIPEGRVLFGRHAEKFKKEFKGKTKHIATIIREFNKLTSSSPDFNKYFN